MVNKQDMSGHYVTRPLLPANPVYYIYIRPIVKAKLYAE